MENTYGSKIKAVRKYLGLTQKEFIEPLGITQGSLSGIESGKENASATLLRLICKEYRINKKWLIDGTDTIMFGEREVAPMPMLNQVYKEVALKSLKESGLPESLIDGVDCSTLEAMEETLDNVKNCFYTSIRKHIADTYGVKVERPETMLRRMEYQECNWWDMFKGMNCDPENNKYIANLHSIINTEVQTGEFSEEWKRMSQKESLLLKIIETGINEEDLDKFKTFLDLQSEMRGQIEKESFICGFRTAYHLLEECRA